MRANAIRPLLSLDRTAIMGIINATPDSFSDGGQFASPDKAVKHGLTLIEEGADILDVGGESTRPGAQKVSIQEELDRVIPLIERLTHTSDIPISIDTSKPDVMRAALSAGAQMINDVNGLQAKGALSVAKEASVPTCIMHMQGEPSNMQSRPKYDNVLSQVLGFFKERVASCVQVGIKRSDVILDPGIGFGKSLNHNLLLLQGLSELKFQTGCAILVGVSRKSLIGDQLDRPLNQRLPASLGLAVQAALNGAKIVRVHDVRATHDAIRMAEAVRDVKTN